MNCNTTNYSSISPSLPAQAKKCGQSARKLMSESRPSHGEKLKRDPGWRKTYPSCVNGGMN